MPVSVRIKVTVPQMKLNSSIIRNRIDNALQKKTGPEIRRKFESTTTGWSRPPKFYQSGHNYPTEISVRVYTNSDVYTYVNNGTPPHTITTRRAGVLRFQPGYRAATRPRVLNSTKAQRFGDIIKTTRVRHPGIEARDFDIEISEQIYPEFVQDVQDAINLGFRR